MATRALRTGILAAVVAASLAACGSDDSSTGSGSEDEELRLGVLTFATDSTYAKAGVEGIEQAASEDGNTDVRVLDGEFSADTQFSQLANAIATDQFDGILIDANDGNFVAPKVKEAIEDGIAVAAYETPVGPDVDDPDNQVEGLTAWSGTPLRDNFDQIIELTKQACEEQGSEPCKILWIPGLLDVAQDQLRDEIVQETFGDDPAYEIVATREGEYAPEPSRVATENTLSATPDLDVVMTPSDQMALGAAQALEQADKTGEVLVIGSGGSEIGIGAIKSGEQFGNAPLFPRDEAYNAATALIEELRGETPSERVQPVVGDIITKENADSFEPQWNGG